MKGIKAIQKTAVVIIAALLIVVLPLPVSAEEVELDQIKTSLGLTDIGVNDEALEAILSQKVEGEDYTYRDLAEVATIEVEFTEGLFYENQLDEALSSINTASNIGYVIEIASTYFNSQGLFGLSLASNLLSSAITYTEFAYNIIQMAKIATLCKIINYYVAMRQIPYDDEEAWGMIGLPPYFQENEEATHTLAKCAWMAKCHRQEVKDSAQSLGETIKKLIETYKDYASGVYTSCYTIDVTAIVIANNGEYPIYDVVLRNERPALPDEVSETISEIQPANKALTFFLSGVDRIDYLDFKVLGAEVSLPFLSYPVLPLFSVETISEFGDYAPREVRFDASPTLLSPGASISKYQWKFGDDFQAESEVVQHTYNIPGEFRVTLTVTLDNGVTCSSSKVIEVLNPVVSAYFTIVPESGTISTNFSFDASGSSTPAGSIISFDWDFGDDNTGSGITTTHTYSQANTYTVTLTVTTSTGVSRTFRRYLSVSSATTASATWVCDVGDVSPHYPGSSQPVVGPDGVIYLGVRDNQDASVGELYALNPDGTIRWELDLEGGPGTPAVGFDGTIYVQTLSGVVYAIDRSGTEEWKFYCEGGSIKGITIGPDGTLYVASSPGLYALNPDGTEKWCYQEKYRLYGPWGASDRWKNFHEGAIGQDGTIYAVFPGAVGTYDCVRGSIHALNPDGSVKWKKGLGGYSMGAPRVAPDGTIYVSGTYLYAYDPSNGEMIWESPIYGNEGAYYYTPSTPIITPDGTIIAGVNHRRFFTSSPPEYFVAAFNPDGERLWIFEPEEDNYGFLNPVTDAEGTVFIPWKMSAASGKELTQIYCIDSTQGTVKQTFNISGALPAAPPTIGVDGYLYIPFTFSTHVEGGGWTYQLKLYAFALKTTGAITSLKLAQIGEYESALTGIKINLRKMNGVPIELSVRKNLLSPPQATRGVINKYWEISSLWSGFEADLTFPYMQAEFDASGIPSESDLFMAWSEDGGTTWHPVPSVVDVVNKTVTVHGITHFPLWAMGGGPDTSLPVTLSSFTAVPGDQEVILRWVTQSEVENAGFNLHRSLKEDGDYTKINAELIKGAGSSPAAHSYSYTDKGLTNGTTYWYKLEDIDLSGKGTMHGPISATPQVPVKAEPVPVPTVYKLAQSYPNPFNPITTIHYQLPKEGFVALNVYNTLGQLVRTLVQEEKPAGYYTIQWDGRDSTGKTVASGIYLYQIQAKDFVQTRKMTLIR